jgi:spore germination protein KC
LIKKIIILLIVTLILAGCWNRRELDDIAITVALGIDKKDDEYLVSVQIINPHEIASTEKTNRTPVTTYAESAPTIFEALRKLTTVSPRKLYLSHIRAVIISEELAREGIANVLDFTNRDHEMRRNFFLLIAKDKTAYDTLNILTPMEQIPANKLFSSLTTSQNAYAATSHVTLDNFIKDYVQEGKQPVITGLKIVGDKQKGKTQKNVESVDAAALLKFEGLGIFKGSKLIGWLDEEESKGYNYITGNVKNTVGHVECPKNTQGKLTVEIFNVETSVKGEVSKNKPKISVEVWGEGLIAEVACKYDFKEKGAIKAVEKVVEKKFQELLNKAILKAKEEQVDIFGFGEVIRRSEPAFWKKNKKEWEASYYEDLKVDINVNFNIRRTGTIDNSFFLNGEE